jgi:hypothetical protein
MNRQPTPSYEPPSRHIFRALRHALRDVLVGWFVFALIGAAATEAIGAYLTRSAPDLSTHIAAVAMALTMGYAAAVTVALRAVIRSLVGSMEWVAGEVERLTGRVVHEAESFVHESGGPSALVPQPAGGRARGSGSASGGMSGGLIGGIE